MNCRFCKKPRPCPFDAEHRGIEAYRDGIVAVAEAAGWKPWGELRKKDGSSYQCFRRGNQYLWIGWRFVQRIGGVEDFVTEPRRAERLIRAR